MPTVVGVRLRFSKTLWFDPGTTAPALDDIVIVETERGTEVGTVAQAPHEVAPADVHAALKPIARVADESDLATIAELAEKEAEALPVFRSLVEEYKLDMKPIDVEYLFGGDKIIFYFSAEERIDFRELVRELASRFHARIDMRQVGVRDEARRVGGLGHCGQTLCCVRFGGEFQPVSIRMAKEQDLPLNPLKISGLCGRLMCCLRYEFDAYKDYKSRAPKRGAIIETPRGLAKVTDLDTPRETVRMRFEDGHSLTVPLGSMQCGKGAGCPCSMSQEALDELDPVPVLAAAPAVRPAAPPKDEPRRGGRTQAREASADAQAAPASQGRKRRRRGGGGGEDKGGSAGKTAGAAKQAPKQSPKPAAEPQAAGGEAGGSDKAASSGGRRRRRRRRSGGGGGESAS